MVKYDLLVVGFGKAGKTLAATLLTGVMAFSAINANAMSPKDQDALSKAQITAVQALSAAQWYETRN